jgi:HlyD family secretion protein
LSTRSPRRRALILAIVALVGCAGVLVYQWWLDKPTAVAIPGVVRETEIHIAPEISGRLASVLVTAGQKVRKGDILAALSTPELAASLEEAKAAAAQARADRENVYAGVRRELVEISAQDVQTAEANLILAQQQIARSTALASKDFASKQQLDEDTAALRKAEANVTLLRAVYARNKSGPTNEERSSVDAKVALADAVTANLEAKLTKTSLVAPVDSEVRLLVAAPGEVISPGQSILTLEAGRERWFTFTIREDQLKGIAIGSSVQLVTARGSTIKGRVTELRPLGEFATWRAARAVGDHDLNNFLLRVDPIATNEDVEPGMTVWLAR